MKTQVSCFGALAFVALLAGGTARGANDCGSIQQQLAALPASGGTVTLGAGTWICSTPIVLDQNNVSLIGAGPTTILRLAASANCPVLIVGSSAAAPSSGVANVTVASLAVDGNRTAQQTECWGGDCITHPVHNDGILIRMSSDVVVKDVTVSSAASGGLVVELSSVRVRVTGLTSFDNAYDGMAGYQTTQSSFSNLSLHDNLAAGLSFDDHFNNNIVHNAVLASNHSDGIFMRDSTGNVFDTMEILNSAQVGIFLAQVDLDASTPATANVFSGVVIENSGGPAMQVANPSCVNNVLSGAVLIGNASCVSQPIPGLVRTSSVVCPGGGGLFFYPM
jgi:hypothetical protein